MNWVTGEKILNISGACQAEYINCTCSSSALQEATISYFLQLTGKYLDAVMYLNVWILIKGKSEDI